MEKFEFETDKTSHAFCERVAHAMAARFGVTVDESMKRINRLWVDPFLGDDDVRYHWLESEWVEHIYAWYEERLTDGTADLPRDVIVSRIREIETRILGSKPEKH